MARRAKDEFPLLTRADSLVGDIRRLVPRAVKQSDSTSIHDVRVATRRLKAILDVLKPILSGAHRKSFGKVLRKIRRRLGPVRDFDVMLDHLGSIGARYRRGVGWIGERLRSRREELRRSAAREICLPKIIGRLGAWWGLHAELLGGQASVDSLLGESLHLQLQAFAQKADALVDDPHALRIAGKALRYTLEMAVVQGHKLPLSVTRSFKQMQDALGLWHDYVVLADCIMKMSLDQQLSHYDAPTADEVMQIARVAVQRSAREMAKFSALWLRNGKEIVAAIHASFPPPPPPLPISGSQMDHDLPGLEESRPPAGEEAGRGETSAA
jgi:CHAD domain-containing protein